MFWGWFVCFSKIVLKIFPIVTLKSQCLPADIIIQVSFQTMEKENEISDNTI